MENHIFEWVTRYASGRLTSEEEEELRIWINQSTENQDTFKQYLKVIKTYRVAFGTRELNYTDSWDALNGKLQRNKGRRLLIKYVAVAASFMLLLGVGIAMWSQERNSTEQKSLIQIYPGNSKATLTLGDGSQINLMDENLKVVQEYGVTIDNDSVSGLQYNQIDVMVEVPVYHTIVVPVTGEYSFTLSDGTKVWMNSDSELRFPTQFVGDKREIFLKGEIYLEVATDSARPFIVHTPEVAVQVLGTKFNMAAYTNEKRVVTTLLEGAVKVMGVGKQQQLRPGEQAIVHLDDATIRTEQVDASVFVSWIKGVFEYENMPLEEIAIQLERWYDVKFVFAAPEFKSRRFTGVVKKYEVLNDVLKLIEKTTNVCFTMNGRVIAVQEVDK